MKRGASTIFIIILSVFLIGIASAEVCNLQVSMINQDPYPAIPGDYVKVVFQIEGVSNPECGVVSFEVKESFPISLDPGTENPITIRSGTYARKYSSFYIAPYKLRIDQDAIDGNNPIEIAYSKSNVDLVKEFDIYVEDTRTDFEVNIKNYNPLTRTLTLEILNTGKVDIQALTVEIPKQENIQVKGTNRVIVGDLDSNEYTTADFEATLSGDSEEINLDIIYTDSINVRRELNKTVSYEPSYFTDRNGEKKSSWWIYVVIAVIVIWFVWRRIKKDKEKKKRMMQKQHH